LAAATEEQHISTSMHLYRMAARIATAAGIPRRISPHSLRHGIHSHSAYVAGV
jgi:integrase